MGNMIYISLLQDIQTEFVKVLQHYRDFHVHLEKTGVLALRQDLKMRH